MEHESLNDLINPQIELEEQVKAKALMRLKYENKDTAIEITDKDSPYYNDPGNNHYII